MEIVGIIFLILLVVVVIRVFSFLSPFILVAFVVAWAKNNGWSTEWIIAVSVALLCGGFVAYVWIMNKYREHQLAKFYENAENARERLDKIYNNKN